LEEPDEDLRAEMFEIAIGEAQSHGLQHYEISSFAKPQARCRHNQSYWNGNDYLAFGPGAARYVDGVRETNHRSVTTWLKLVESGHSPVTDRQILNPREIAIDRLVFGLRQIDGVSIPEFVAATQLDPIALLGGSADLLFRESLIEFDGNSCKLTPRGIMLYDGVAKEIISAANP
jgi:oxygen-independent coproporphyrinogen-3 oxidase